MNTMTRWKPLIYRGIDFSDRFLISDCGDLYSLKTKKILKQTSANGYMMYIASLGCRGKNKAIKIHIAVAENFVSGKKDGLTVNHIDGDKSNNHYTNLEWVTQSENIKHAYKTGLAKSSQAKRVKCVNTGEIFDSISAAGRWCGVKKSTIQNMLKGKAKHAGIHPVTGERIVWEFV